MNKILLALFAFFNVVENISAQVISETVMVESKPIRMQKLTLSCGYWAPEDRHWKQIERIYTLHIIDNEALRSIGASPRIKGLGWYAWSDNSWNKFSSITENVFWLTSERDIDFGTQSTCSLRRGCRDMAPFEITLNYYDKGINRSTLEMMIETGNYSASLKGLGQSADYEDPVWPSDIPSDRGKCKLLQYRKPPERIGF